MNKLKELHAALILYTDNFHTLHYLLCGPSFYDDHERYKGWYNELFEFQDSIGELVISMGDRPDNIISAVDALKSSSKEYTIMDTSIDYTQNQADVYAHKMFTDLYELACEIAEDKESYPTDVRSEVRKLAKYIRIEDKYKMSRRLCNKEW